VVEQLRVGLEQLRAALPRLLALLGIVLGGTTAVAVIFGALTGKNIAHALATGYYLVGAAVLIGSFVMGSRGPWRTDTDPAVQDPRLAAYRTRPRRKRRKATNEERAESKRGSFGLFVLGIALVLLGALVDPSRRAF